MAQVFKRDDDGNVIDPPVNPDIERELTRARDSGDPENIARVQQRYDDWRSDEVERIESDAQPTDTQTTDAVNAGPTPGAEPVNPATPDPTQVPAPAPGNDGGNGSNSGTPAGA